MLRNFRYVALVLVSLAALSACSSTNNAKTGAAGAGGPGSLSSVDSEVIPGSQKDLETNVGDRVFFGYDSSVLDSEAQATLARQADFLKKYSNVSATVEGHCDERGTREYNIALGERRAVAVRNFLVNSGISAGRLSVISYGKERPAVLGGTEEAWGQNRRGVLVIN